MNAPVSLAVITMVIGVILLLRATVIVTTKAMGRFAADPLITMALGFGLILLGQYLLR